MAVKKTKSKAPRKTVKKTVKKASGIKAVKTATARKKMPAKPPQKKKPANVNTKAASKPQKPTNNFAEAFPQLKDMENMMKNQPFQFDQLAQDAANQSREGFEAFAKSGEIFAKGFESIMQTAASLTQDVAEKQATFMQTMMGAKTPNEFAEVQNKIAQENFDQFMTGATKISEMSVKVLSEASEPINEQMTKAMSKAKAAA